MQSLFVCCHFDGISLLQLGKGRTTGMEQEGEGDDWLSVPVGARQSEHSAATSSTQEVEDCEDLEVVGIDSETNVAGMTWTENAGMLNGVTIGESFTKIEGLQRTPGKRRESDFDSESDIDDDNTGGDGQIKDSATRPASSTSSRNFSQAVGLKENTGSIKSRENSDDRSGDVNNSDCNRTQKNLDTAHQNSTYVEELRKSPGQYGRPENHDDDDDADNDFDDEDEPTDVAVKQDKDHICQENNPVAAALATASAAEPVCNDQSFYRACSSGSNASDNDDDDDDKVDDTRTRNNAAVPLAGASDSFDDVFAKNVDADPQRVAQNVITEDICTDVDNCRRSRLSRQRCEVEEAEERRPGDLNTANREHDGMGNWSASASRVLQSLPEDDGSDSEEDIEAFGDKAVNVVTSEVNSLKSPGETRPTDKKADSGRTDSEVRILTVVFSRIITGTYVRTMHKSFFTRRCANNFFER